MTPNLIPSNELKIKKEPNCDMVKTNDILLEEESQAPLHNRVVVERVGLERKKFNQNKKKGQKEG